MSNNRTGVNNLVQTPKETQIKLRFLTFYNLLKLALKSMT